MIELIIIYAIIVKYLSHDNYLLVSVYSFITENIFKNNKIIFFNLTFFSEVNMEVEFSEILKPFEI